MEQNISEVEIDQLANLARSAGTHYQIRTERRRPRSMRNASAARRLLNRLVQALKI